MNEDVKEETKDDLRKSNKPDKVRQLRTENKEGRRIRIQFDLDYAGSPGAEIPGKSMTVPDMNLTVTQLLQNHTRGKSGNVMAYEPLYFETEIPVINDITDVDRYKQQLQDRLAEVNEFIENEKQLKDAEENRKAKEQEDDVQRVSEEKTEPSSK